MDTEVTRIEVDRSMAVQARGFLDTDAGKEFWRNLEQRYSAVVLAAVAQSPLHARAAVELQALAEYFGGKLEIIKVTTEHLARLKDHTNSDDF